MAKYNGIFFLTLMLSVILFFALAVVFDGGNSAETVIYILGTIIIILISFSISLLFYLIDLLKKKM
ncbi:hypothetical protein [Lysinibacillus xylanilyticus]|uniref:hypothetical protein n=1 Tax=Lysinibacillus xylanilyticus TaxID=582475 RepID=UPI003D055AFB